MEMIELVFEYILASVLYSECVAGAILNLIIVAANFLKWKTMKSLNIGDKIISSLATSRSFFLCIYFMFFLCFLLNLWENNIQARSTVTTIITVFHSTNLWFATVLCVFYCVKITSYNWKFFIFLKTKISTLVPWFLFASLLIAVFSGLPFAWCIYKIEIQNLTNILMENMTLSRAVVQEDSTALFMLLLIISCPPFLVFCVADCLLLHSLWMHTRRMRSSGSGFRSPNLESHFSAVKSMSFFLVLQMLYFCMTMYMFGAVDTGTTAMWISAIVICSAPSIHSLYMISSYSELRKTCVSLFHFLTCCTQG